MLPTKQEVQSVLSDFNLHKISEVVNGTKVLVLNYDDPLITNPITRKLRGAVFLEDLTPIAEPFHQFYTVQDCPLQLSEIASLAPEISTKIDGVMVMVYYLNGWVVSTRSGSHTEHAERAGEFLWKNENYKKFLDSLLETGDGGQGTNHSFHVPRPLALFEYVADWIDSIVHYEEENMYLIGIRDANGKLLSYKNVIKAGSNFNIPTCYLKQIPLRNLIKNQLSYDSVFREGFVIRFGDEDFLKIKNSKWRDLFAEKNF